MLQINRYVAGDAWVAGELLQALARAPTRPAHAAPPSGAAIRGRRGDDRRAGPSRPGTTATAAGSTG